MKRMLTLTAILAMVTMWTLPATLMAGEEGQCYLLATEDIYVKIYRLGEHGVEHFAHWEGHLAAGETKSYDAPYGEIAYAYRSGENDPWNSNQEPCYGGDEIEVP